MNPIEVKASPAYWIMGFVVSVAGATIAIDTRYAKAADVLNAKAELKQEMAVQRAYTEAGFLKQRKAQLEDKVFELEAKHEEKKISSVELKQLFRYRSELEDVNRDLRKR